MQWVYSVSDLYLGNNLTLEEAQKPAKSLNTAVQGNNSHLHLFS